MAGFGWMLLQGSEMPLSFASLFCRVISPLLGQSQQSLLESPGLLGAIALDSKKKENVGDMQPFCKDP